MKSCRRLITAASYLAFIVLLGGATRASERAPIASIAGVYKMRVQRVADGRPVTHEDILELVRYDDKSIYVRVVTHADNGHGCDISGLARWDGQAFIHKKLIPEDRKQFTEAQGCKLRLLPRAGSLRVEDPSSGCTFLACSARAYLISGVEFPRSARRSIRYMPRLLRSGEYRSSVERATKPLVPEP